MQITDPVARGGVPSGHRPFNGVKVFSATLFPERERLTETIAAWLADQPQLQIIQMVVTQSGAAAFQCIAVTVFYWEPLSPVALS